MYPHWRNDGRELIYVATNISRMVAVPVEIKGSSVTIGTPTPLMPSTNVSTTVGDIKQNHSQILLAMSQKAQVNEPLTLVINWPATIGK